MREKIWSCQIGEVSDSLIPDGGDSPMRVAVQEAYFRLTGQLPTFCFSGWGDELDSVRRGIVENDKIAARNPGKMINGTQYPG
jgi:hypothetical protein